MVDADVERYDRAQGLVEKVLAEWTSEGCPLLTEGGATGRALVTHPLVKLLQEAERDADRFWRVLQRRHAGPQAGAVVQASIGKSPAATLRSVG